MGEYRDVAGYDWVINYPAQTKNPRAAPGCQASPTKILHHLFISLALKG
jgi:hypothetical protein